MSGDKLSLYCCAPTVVWVKDANQTLLVEEETMHTWTIRGIEAVIWDLLTLNYSFGGIVRFLSMLLEITNDDAWRTLQSIVQAWEEEGILRAMGRNRHG